MSDNPKYLPIGIGTVLLLLVVMIFGLLMKLSTDYTARTKAAFENGYEEGAVQGNPGVHWVRASCPHCGLGD